MSAEAMLVDKAQLLRLSAPEMTALVGGMDQPLGSGLDSFLLHKHPEGQVLTLSPFTR